MIELRTNATGKLERPGADAFGRVYRIVNLANGAVFYNYTGSDLPGLDPAQVAMIEKYETFRGWVTEIIDVQTARAKVAELNAAPREFIETPHTLLVARIKRRLHEGHAGVIDQHSVLDDMREMYLVIKGGRDRPPLLGWE